MKRWPFRLQSCQGLTLTELMVVVGIIGILTAVAIPNYLDWNRKYKLKDAVGLLHANLNMARLNAINQNAKATVTVTQAAATDPIIVTFTGISGLSTLTIPDTGTPEVSLTNANGETVGGGTPTVISPQSVRFNSMGMRENTGSGLCIFTDSGLYTASNTCTGASQAFNFKNSIGNNYRIVVASTGKVSWCYTNSCAQ